MPSVKSLQKIRRRLEAERERLQSHIEELTALLRGQDREIGLGEDDADIAARAVSYNRLMMLLETEQHALEDANDALLAMDEGTYGFCVVCGQEIGLARLEARPFAFRCVTCQEREGG